MRRVLSSSLLLALGGCGGMPVSQFAGGQPSMAPQSWMVGTDEGYGIIVDRFGTVKSQFQAHEVGNWNPATHTVTLVEHITYLQGSKQKPTDRTWHFTETTPGRWTATANDTIGTGHAEQQGNAWHLVYRQTLPIGGSQVAVTVDDWRLREADNVAIDDSRISKLGVNLARAEIAFVKVNERRASRR